MQNVSANAKLAPKKRKSISYDKYGYLFVAPFFITFIIFSLYPIFFTFRTSLTDAAGWAKVLDNKIVGFDSFAKLFDFGSEISKFSGSLWVIPSSSGSSTSFPRSVWL